jgi:hypothetical protein
MLIINYKLSLIQKLTYKNYYEKIGFSKGLSWWINTLTQVRAYPYYGLGRQGCTIRRCSISLRYEAINQGKFVITN